MTAPVMHNALAPRDGASRQARRPGWIYRELGVEPVINCTGVRTSYGGCNPTPEVLAAMASASEAFVDVDELQAAIGRRLARLTEAEWGIVTAGSVAALSLATAACVVGNDPEKMLMLPHDFGRTVAVARDQRMPYEHAIRAVGCSLTEIAHHSDLERLSPESVAAICLVGHDIATSSLSFAETVRVARERDIPVIVDAAGLAPRFPNEWLSGGADLLIHSGGKYIEGPQSTGFLLGRERLCRAALFNGPPHQAFGRSMKVGKDEIVGAYVAMERWISDRRIDQKKRIWTECIARMAAELDSLQGLHIEILEPDGAFCNPRLAVSWDGSKYPMNSYEISDRLASGMPRIMLHDYWLQPHKIVIDPTNLTFEDAVAVAVAIKSALAEPLRPVVRSLAAMTPFLAGTWCVEISFLHGAAKHSLVLDQDGERLSGIHVGTQSSGPCSGTVRGAQLALTSELAGYPMAKHFAFEGLVDDGEIAGTVLLGASTAKHAGPTFKRQFGQASWSARRVPSDQTGEVRP